MPLRRLLIAMSLLWALVPWRGAGAQGVLRLGDLEVPPPVGYVNDFAGVLSASQRRSLESFLRRFDAATGAQFALVTLPSLEGNDRNDVAVRIFETWRIGRQDDRGLLLLDAIQEREMKVEVGYGLEGILPDGLVGELRDRYFTRPFAGEAEITSEERYRAYVGILTAMAEIVARDRGMRLEDILQGPAPPASRTGRRRASRWGLLPLLLLLVIFMRVFRRNPLLGMILLMGMSGGHRHRGFGGGFGGFGGGFGGFGGGMSGGGGAGGSY
jgi:uncharacterized protein